MKKRTWEPIRNPAHDGKVGIRRVGPYEHDFLEISVTHEGVDQTIVLSEWNARRIFGMLSIFLKLPLAPSVGKQIKMGPGGVTTTMAPDRPLQSFGERVAYYLTQKETKRVMKEKYGDAIEFVPVGEKKEKSDE